MTVAKQMSLLKFMESSSGMLTPDVLDMAGYPKATLTPSVEHYNGTNYRQVQDSKDKQIRAARKWCEQNYGEGYAYATNGSSFWFDTPEQVMMFKLRWG